MDAHILYSFRRCPYAIRARLALKYANINYEHREIVFSNKPVEMLKASPKGTVPVLILKEGVVIDESIEIMEWSVQQNDPENWRDNIKDDFIIQNDSFFKPSLDIYKYSDRYSNEENAQAFINCMGFLNNFEKSVNSLSMLTQMAILPFIRQFAKVDMDKFLSLDIKNTQKWLDHNLNSELFLSVMKKYPVWSEPKTDAC